MTCGCATQVLDNDWRFSRGSGVQADHEFTEGVRLAAIAVVSAVVTATLVIGVGRSLLPQPEVQAREQPALVAASLR